MSPTKKDEMGSRGRLILPLPPTLNHAYRNFVHPSGRRMRVLTREAERFREEAAWLAKAWAMQTGWSMPPPRTKVYLRLWYFWPDWRRADANNREKVLLDALEGVLYPDDRWVLVWEMDFDVDRERPRVEIEISAGDVPCAMSS
ncbi:RusA family crossover junction endodeoxyribonuclease [Alicyclobacillus macrosporangiidus]|uniref:Crossover junction endodeoxyribonuclease RusA n=1 Tax=Alicyclobacillus macrosporangiidus TaxID=392015 RepID=A0A1I7J9G2_9BACL|nr:RusA family crossover junction endodeoxyribonuclease [Alicyclobacillus macrosporangiidus]SFU81793.1 crossover junction endodeoxyribonuclease RusA [Alicyclobacillus macrosporangiidus]